MSWDALQLETLQAMGLQPMRRVPAADAPAELSSALQAALQRAAGGPGVILPPITMKMAVHTAAGKRALWPQLRALRRGR